MAFHTFYQWFTRICTPDEKFSPDYKVRSLAATKTKSQLLFYLFFLFAALSDLIRGVVPIIPQSVRILQVSLLIVTLIICCRSHLDVYYMIITLIISFGTMLVTMRGEVLYSLGAGFFAIVIIYIITDKWYYTGFTAIVHVCNYQLVLKQKIEIAILTMGTQEFCNKLIDVCSFQLIMSMLMLCSLHRALKRINEELWESKSKAEGSLSHYKTFLFSFSHEIRNPINILLGSLEMALQEYLPSSALDMIQTAKISGELLLQLINNVLDVGKAEVEKLEIVPTPTRVHDLLIRMWSICAELIKKKKLSGYLKISTSLPRTLELDPDRTNQVLLNLMGNAIKFTDRGNVNLTIEWIPNRETVTQDCFRPLPFDKDEEGVFDKNESFSTLGYSNGTVPGYFNNFYVMTHTQRRLSKDDSQGSKVEQMLRGYQQMGILKIIVKDQGCGMSSEAMKGLFKKFYQCSPEASQRKRGTGLGLYITKDIVESMGGEIKAFSEENRGSVFVACIPCKRVNDQY